MKYRKVISDMGCSLLRNKMVQGARVPHSDIMHRESGKVETIPRPDHFGGCIKQGTTESGKHRLGCSNSGGVFLHEVNTYNEFYEFIKGLKSSAFRLYRPFNAPN